jgi:hypothetical protein
MKEKYPNATIITRLVHERLEELLNSLPDGPEKDALILEFIGAEREDNAEDLKTVETRRRVEKLYLSELDLRDWPNDDAIEELILDTLHLAFLAQIGPDRTYKLFAAHAVESIKHQPDSARPRTGRTDKKTFVRAFLYSNQTKYAFTKWVAKINAALPPERRFGCLSTTREDVETQLERALKQWGDIVRKEMSPGQK